MHQNLQCSGHHTLYGVFDAPMFVAYLYNRHKMAVVSIADHSHFLICHFGAVAHKWFQKRLSVPQLNQILRRGDVIFSLPS